MTPECVLEALAELGISFKPEPSVLEPEAQYGSPDDPFPQERNSISINECIALAEWAAGKRVLEIGTGLGVSTVGLAEEATEVVTVDPQEWVRRAITFPDNVVTLASTDDVVGPFDLAFIDGAHDTESVHRDIKFCLSVVKPGGHIAFHDVSWCEIDRIIGEYPWTLREERPTVGKLTRCQVPA